MCWETVRGPLYVLVISVVLCVNSNTAHRKRTSVFAKTSCDFRWSAWSEFSPCSRSCGLGIKSRHRTCYEYGVQSRPVNGGNCKGKTVDQQACNTQACPAGSRDFRELQCSFFTGQQYRGKSYHWTAFILGSDLCVLRCSAVGHRDIVVKFASQVVDGTQCGTSPHRVCVSGLCVPIGCDNKPYSNKTIDRCGVCGGGNHTCHTLARTITHRVPAGYTEVLRVPARARYIKVTERTRSTVILGLKRMWGRYPVGSDGSGTETVLFAGTVVYYHHSSTGLETLRAEGPINETMTVLVYSRTPGVVSLVYEYTVPNIVTHLFTKNLPHQDENPEPSHPWQSLIYKHVLPQWGALAPATSVKATPIAHITSTVAPHCNPPGNSTRFNHSHQSRKHRRFRVERFQILKVRTQKYSKQHRNTQRRKTHKFPVLVSNKRKEAPRFNTKHSRRTKSPQPPKLYYLKTKAKTDHLEHGRTRIDHSSKPSKPPYSVTNNHRMNISPTRVIKGNVTLIQPSRTHRTPVEEPRPTFMPSVGDNDNQPLKKESVRDAKKDEAPDVQVDLSIKVAATKSQKADKRRRGRDRGRKRKKNEREIKGVFAWKANDVTPCTATCELGTTETLFGCYQDNSGNRVDDKYCDQETKPAPAYHVCSSQTCKPRWVAGLWTECSRSCEEGQQQRSARCWQMMAPGFDSTVRDFKCNPDEKPETVRKCHKLTSCVPQWEMSAWEECSNECGFGVQLRHIRCSAEDEAACLARKRPLDKRPCRNTPCTNQWYTLPWSSCSGMCGIRKRNVYCRDAHGRVVDDRQCDFNSKPLTVHACGRCKNKWVPQEWAECSATCGEGVKTRRVVCGTTRGNTFHIRPDSFCVKEVRPPTTATCRIAPCGATWYITEWSECSESCGTAGVRYRQVKCYGGRDSELCDAKTRPEVREQCKLPACQHEAVCEDDGETRCDLVHSAKLCSNQYYRKACCRTCS